jgi:hypothetical protein
MRVRSQRSASSGRVTEAMAQVDLEIGRFASVNAVDFVNSSAKSNLGINFRKKENSFNCPFLSITKRKAVRLTEIGGYRRIFDKGEAQAGMTKRVRALKE